MWLWRESIRSRALEESGHLLGKGQRKSKEQGGKETPTREASMFRMENRDSGSTGFPLSAR